MKTETVQSRIAKIRRLLLECESALRAENTSLSRQSPEILSRVTTALQNLDELGTASGIGPETADSAETSIGANELESITAPRWATAGAAP